MTFLSCGQSQRLKPKSISQFLLNQTPRIGQTFPKQIGDSNRKQLLPPYHEFPDITKLYWESPIHIGYEFSISCNGEPERKFASYNSLTRTLAIDKNTDGKIDEVVYNFSEEDLAEEISLAAPKCP